MGLGPSLQVHSAALGPKRPSPQSRTTSPLTASAHNIPLEPLSPMLQFKLLIIASHSKRWCHQVELTGSIIPAREPPANLVNGASIHNASGDTSPLADRSSDPHTASRNVPASEDASPQAANGISIPNNFRGAMNYMYQQHVMTSLPDQSLALTPQVVLTGSTHWDQPPPPPHYLSFNAS